MGTNTKIRNHSKNPLKNIILIFIIGIISIVIIACVFLCVLTMQIASNLPDVSNSSIFNLAQNSRIYAADGETVLAELQLENREPVSSLDEISDNVIKATIATEDARFYEHHGVDVFGLFRAFSVILFGGNTQGGSTITMQLMRNTILTKEAQIISIERKIAEILLALEIEKIYSKDEILLMYLNTINYGDGCYGIKAASKHYYSKLPEALDLNESATLVGIPQSPTYLSPSNNIEACKIRRDTVLERMYDDHVITNESLTNTEALDIQLNIGHNDLATNYKYPYFTNYVRDQIMEKYTNAEIFEGGFQIYTTLDIKHQEACEKGCSSQNAKLEKEAESVAVTVDPSNGFVTAMVGGDNYQNNQYNIVTSKGRPTGSSFKMFTLVTAIEQGYDPYSYVIDCSGPMRVGNTRIENFGNSSYGNRTIQSAVAISSNTGMVRLQEKVGTDNVIKTAQKMGIKQANLPNVSTLTLGVADVNPLEMASAYATLASGGIYHEPISIQKIETANGETIFKYDPDDEKYQGERVLEENIAAATTKVLQTVFTQGTASSAQLSSRQQVAGKTGTSEDYRDHTLIGYTPFISLATWIGKRNYKPTSSSVSCNSLFKNIMDSICKNHEIVNFPKLPDPVYKMKSELEKKEKDEKEEEVDPQTEILLKAPNTVGRTISEAKSILASYDLTVYYSYSDTYPNGTVMQQGVENHRIVLRVSKGAAPPQ